MTVTSRYGYTALMLAAQSGWFPVVERLLQEDQIDLDKVAGLKRHLSSSSSSSSSSSLSMSSLRVVPAKVNKAGRMAEQCGRKGAKQQVELMITRIIYMIRMFMTMIRWS